MSLKNIVYIDYDKVYSLSAQLFEGLVHTATQKKEISFQDTETIIVKERTSSDSEEDRNTLSTIINPHDYHYLKFEKEIASQNKILIIDSDEIDQNLLLNSQFVKIKAKINLIDYSKLKFTTKNFTKIGHAINYVHRNEELQALDELLKKTQGVDKRKVQAAKDKVTDEIKESSMYSQKEYLEKLSEVLDFAYGDDVEITQNIGNLSATSFFSKDFFKLPLEMFIKRYSRKTIKEFTIVGTITQISIAQHIEEETLPENMRIAARKMSDALYAVESTFCTPLKNEVFVEPIAMYTEI